MDLNYKFQVKLMTSQTLRSDFDKQISKPTDPRFLFTMFRFQIVDPELTNSSDQLAHSLMEKLFEFQDQRTEDHQELNNNNKYSFFKIKPVSETLKRNMLEKIIEVADEALVKAKNVSDNKSQICLLLTVNGKPAEDGGGDEGIVREEHCVICGEEFEKIKGVVMLSCECKYLYHNACIWKWLRQNHKCPTCRFNFALSRGQFSVPTWKWLPELRKKKRESSSGGTQ